MRRSHRPYLEGGRRTAKAYLLHTSLGPIFFDRAPLWEPLPGSTTYPPSAANSRIPIAEGHIGLVFSFSYIKNVMGCSLQSSRMSRNPRRLAIATAVYLGAIVLVGLPSLLLFYSVGGAVLTAIGGEQLVDHPLWVLHVAVSILVGLQLAVEAAALQLHGVSALWRGSTWATIARHLLISVVALLGLLWAGQAGLALVTSIGSPEAVVLGTLLVLAAVLVLLRGLFAFTHEFRKSTSR